MSSKIIQTLNVLQASRKIFSTVWGVSPSLLFLTTVLSLLLGFFPILNVFITKEMIDQAVLMIQQESESAKLFYFWLVVQTVAYLIMLGMNAWERTVSTALELKVRLYYDKTIAEKASKLSLIHFESSDYHDKFSRVRLGITDKALQILTSTVRIIQSLVTVSGFSVLLLNFHWIMGIAMILFVIPSLWLNIFIGKRRYSQMFIQTPTTRKISYLSYLLMDRAAAKELRVFQLQSYLINKLEFLYKKNAEEKITLEKKVAYVSFGVDGVANILLYTGIGFLLWVSSVGSISVGYFVSLVQAMTTTQGMLQQTAIQISILHENSLYFDNFDEFMDLPEHSSSNSTRKFPSNLQQGIYIQNLSFSYPHQPDKKVLNDVSFVIRPGEKVAIVGENGAGKSTLIKCLLGLYSPTEGDIFFDDIPISEIDPNDLGRHVTATFQDFATYQLTLRENIGMGDIDYLNDEYRILEAARKGDSYNIIRKIKQGLDSELGFAFHGGIELSHGQWQKIAISRSFLREAPILILDEPTSSLDPLSEAKVFERCLSLTKDKTAIFISHRLGSCRMMDRIIVLKDGFVVEQGSHDQLIQMNGEYTKLFQSQAKWYTDKSIAI